MSMIAIPQLDETNPRLPALIDTCNGLSICFEGYGWNLPRVEEMMEGQEEGRYADICGDDVAAIADEGWHFTAPPLCLTAAHAGVVVAAAWAGPIRTEVGEAGCNLTYAVAPSFEGKGLAKLLTAAAFLAADRQHPHMDFANIESRATNQASAALARSLGFVRHPEGDFTMETSCGGPDVPFHCYRLDARDLRRVAREVLRKKSAFQLLAWIDGDEPVRAD